MPEVAGGIMPEKEGYVFQGWLDEEGNEARLERPVWSDLTFKASWRPVSFHVAFYGNGGKGRMAKQAFVYGKNGKLFKNCYTRKGYQFAGWNTGKDGKRLSRIL